MTLQRILVGVDGSDAAAGALRWAADLAVATGAELLATTAWRPTQAEASPEIRAELAAGARRALEGPWSEPARAAGARTRTLFLDDDIDGLLAAAEREAADLVAVGPRGVGGFAALHIGSVAHHLARHTDRPLAIVPAHRGHDHVQRIVVGADGSSGAAAAIAWCAENAPALGASVIGVLACDPGPAWQHRPRADVDHDAVVEAAGESLENWTRPIRDAGVPLEPVVVDATHPVDALSLTAQERDADLLVVGTHGVGGFSGMRLGGVTVQLVHHMHLPVVMVPPAHEDETSQ